MEEGMEEGFFLKNTKLEVQDVRKRNRLRTREAVCEVYGLTVRELCFGLVCCSSILAQSLTVDETDECVDEAGRHLTGLSYLPCSSSSFPSLAYLSWRTTLSLCCEKQAAHRIVLHTLLRSSNWITALRRCTLVIHFRDHL